ncbi:unnamed protein product [Spirodela intermedia]|uniref:V-type proton ATPase subunit a n=1 Tax=Spirodela intermedia TaxID=51605 RepID=A0A7I8IGI7_SPIIN|nr:unnamed protein product [Spirodela intermedia]CAA6656404.1 unnamed protein product [Spirodela intermedia]
MDGEGGGTTGGWCCPPIHLMRSEPMQLVQLIIPIESAHLTLSYVGELGLLQFKDRKDLSGNDPFSPYFICDCDRRWPLNIDKSPFQRTYAYQMWGNGTQIRFFRDQMWKAGIVPSVMPLMDEVNFDDLEAKLGELEAELIEVNANSEKLQRTYNELLEYKLVLQKAGEFFYSAQSDAAAQQREIEARSVGDESIDRPLLLEQEISTDLSKQIKLGFVSGLVPKEKSMAFERILFRATRATSKTKILKICEAFGANRYPFTEDVSKQRQMIEEVEGRISELKTTIDIGLLHRDKLLKNIGYQYESWNHLVKKEKSVYHTLNMLSLDVSKKCLVAEGWSPKFAASQIQDALERAALDSNSQVGSIFQVLQSKELPPTYFRTNKFSSAFQEIVDAYGVAKYQEANPAVYTIVTFPFLFAVMFGDWGTAYAYCLPQYITEMTFGGRYVIMMMALFSIYTGLVYNEFFSVPFELFGQSAYACRDPSCRDASTNGLIKVRRTYPFGVDPVWHGSRSELPFLNSLKMKMSILLGVAQMNLGILMSFFNGLFFRNGLNIWYQFIPQLIFLNSLFGYLSLLIIVKWCTGSKADLYHVMIYMFLSPTDDLGENQLIVGQKTLQLVLILLALISVPWMLFPKPFLMKRQHEARHQGQSYALLNSSDVDSAEIEADHSSHGHEEFDFSEVFVHQLIHTIEFVLESVSNTASYLRLWALSLAHSELSSVFYEKVLLLAWGYNNIIILIIGGIVFICATIGVLLVMETLSAFLHALRLHWVEFQNKFYEADGYKFAPFSFATVEEEG